MGYLIKSNVINALEEDMQDTMMCYKGKREKDIIAFCYESMERTIEELPQYRVDNVVEETGLTHEQIMELKGRDTAKVTNKKLRHRGGFETFHCQNCDTSYQMDRRYTITDEYCPKCGKLLDSSFRSFCANCGQRLEEGRQC